MGISPRRDGTKAQRHKGTKVLNNAPSSRLIRLCRNRIASRTGWMGKVATKGIKNTKFLIRALGRLLPLLASLAIFARSLSFFILHLSPNSSFFIPHSSFARLGAPPCSLWFFLSLPWRTWRALREDLIAPAYQTSRGCCPKPPLSKYWVSFSRLALPRIHAAEQGCSCPTKYTRLHAVGQRHPCRADQVQRKIWHSRAIAG